MKKISVVITTFRRSSLLKSCLNSITLNKPDEIIIVNDDPSENLVVGSEQKIDIIQHKHNLGLCAARNTGMEKANGDYIAFCDDDDLWMPQYLNEIRKVLRHGPDMIIALDTKYKWLFSNQELLLSELLNLGVTPPVSAQIYYKKLLKKVRYDTRITSGIDLDFWINLLQIDPKVTIVFGSFVRQQEHVGDRITNNFKKRIKGLEKTVCLWDDALKNDQKYIALRDTLINGYVRYLERKFFKEIFIYQIKFRRIFFLGRKLNAFSGLLAILKRGFMSKFLSKKYATFQ